MSRPHRCRCGRQADATGSLLLLKAKGPMPAGDRIPFGICFDCLDGLNSMRPEVAPDDGPLLRVARSIR